MVRKINVTQTAIAPIDSPIAPIASQFNDPGMNGLYRAVIDKLSQLAASANFPNRALESRINAIVDEIIAEYSQLQDAAE